MEKVRKIIYNDTKILILDYSDSKGKELIEIFNIARELVLAEAKPVLVLNILNSKTFLNSDFIRHVEREVKALDNMIDKQAVIGISRIQDWILKGINLWYKTQIKKCDNMDEALKYLVKTKDK